MVFSGLHFPLFKYIGWGLNELEKELIQLLNWKTEQNKMITFPLFMEVPAIFKHIATCV